MIKNKLLIIIFLSLGLITACSQEETSAAVNVDKVDDESPAIGTDIKTVVKKPSNEKNMGEVKMIMWEDLIPNDFKPESIMKKYAKELESIDEADEQNPEAQALMNKIIAEFNNAPANKELNGVKVKIPGFIALLDEKDGMVNEFLLVPYFGSCIHSPPPPVNQTVLVKVKKGKSIPMEDIYRPVWVTGKVKVERQKTDLAQAGYLIQDAELELYEREEAEGADSRQ